MPGKGKGFRTLVEPTADDADEGSAAPASSSANGRSTCSRIVESLPSLPSRARANSNTRHYTPVELAQVPLPAELLDGTWESDFDRPDYLESQIGEQFPGGGGGGGGGGYSAAEALGDLKQQAWSFVASAAGPDCCSVATLQKRVPATTWLPGYTAAQLKADVLAGITVGVVLVPQGAAYAMLAELPPIYGLYSALLPLPVYACLATSKHMSVGPFALVSLLVADSVSLVVSPDDPSKYVPAVMLLSLMIGMLHMLMAALNLGIIVRFISDSVLAGFTSAAAILITTSQLKHLLGMQIPRMQLFWKLK